MQVTLLSLSLALAPAAFAGNDADPPAPHHHPSGWYSGWSLVIAGGTTALVGVALTTQDQQTTQAVGWTLAGIGTASWVAGALVLKLTERREQRRAGR